MCYIGIKTHSKACANGTGLELLYYCNAHGCNTLFMVSIVSYTFGDSHNWGQRHLKKVQQCRLHQPESGHYWQQTALLEGDHLEGQSKSIYLEIITHHNYKTFKVSRLKRVLPSGNSRRLVVNSLSRALVDWIKSEATIIGVKHTSQLYFLTKDLNASLWGQIILQREWQLDKKKKTHLQYLRATMPVSHHSYAFGARTFMTRAIQLTLNIGPLAHIFLGLCLFQTDPLYWWLCRWKSLFFTVNW